MLVVMLQVPAGHHVNGLFALSETGEIIETGKVCVRLSSRSAEREPRGFITQSHLKSYLVTNTQCFLMK